MWCKFIICNLFHRYYWRDIIDFERRGLKLTKPIHCLICDGPMEAERLESK